MSAPTLHGMDKAEVVILLDPVESEKLFRQLFQGRVGFISLAQNNLARGS